MEEDVKKLFGFESISNYVAIAMDGTGQIKVANSGNAFTQVGMLDFMKDRLMTTMIKVSQEPPKA